jgi:DNA-binding NarL/FixJ family response regulator
MDSPPPKKPRVVIADSLAASRFAIRTLVQAQGGMEICAEAACAPAAIELCQRLAPEIVIFDLKIARGTGLDLLHDFQRASSGVRRVIWTEEEDAFMVQRAFVLGATAYFTKNDEPAEILEGLRVVANGSGSFASKRVSQFPARIERFANAAVRLQIESLSEREFHVLWLIARGLGTTAISHELSISVKTVETHKAHLKEKLRLAGAEDLHRYAVSFVATAVDGGSNAG